MRAESSSAASELTALVSAVESNTRASLQAFNSSLSLVLGAQNQTVAATIEGLLVAVARQLDAVKQMTETKATSLEVSMKAAQDTLTMGASTLSERLTGVIARVSRLDDLLSTLTETVATSKEKLALLDQAHKQQVETFREHRTVVTDDERRRKAEHDAALQAIATQQQAHSSSLSTLTGSTSNLLSQLEKTEAALQAATSFANALSTSNMNLVTRLEKLESENKQGEAQQGALRERIARLEALVELLMKK